MDYAFLRQEGIRWLEQLAGDQWTDFNTHDPGITILEQLCYALTDLGRSLAAPVMALGAWAFANLPTIHDRRAAYDGARPA